LPRNSAAFNTNVCRINSKFHITLIFMKLTLTRKKTSCIIAYYNRI
jgi:hypothetical protein